MPAYEFVCPNCGVRQILEQRMLENHVPPLCPCGTKTHRIFSSAFHCDEIRGVTYHDPVKNASVRGHGKYFDLGLGKYIESKSQRRRIIKQKGFKEYGIREV